MSNRVSVLLPVYNCEDFIEVSLKSIQQQTYKNLEIIVIDDGSTDSTSKLIKDIAAKDHRIQIISKANSGIVDSLNIGLGKVTGDFIARQDGDDISVANRIENQLNFLIENTNAIAVGASFYFIDKMDNFLGQRFRRHGREIGDYTELPAWEPYLPHPFLMIRSNALKKLGYRHVLHCEDADLYWRALRLGEIWNIENVGGLYRIHNQSISAKSSHNGRIQAAFSQLAAISARRVDLYSDDLEFSRDLLLKSEKWKNFDDIFNYFRGYLSDSEFEYFKNATLLQFLDYSSFRPYEISFNDLNLISACINKNKKSLAHRYNKFRSIEKQQYKKLFGHSWHVHRLKQSILTWLQLQRFPWRLS